MHSIEELEELLKEGGTWEEEEARRLFHDNAANGGLLREAAEKGLLNVVKFFVESREQFELTVQEELMCSNSAAVDGDGNTPLHLAAIKGHINIVECIIASGADVHVSNKYEETPLCHACWAGHEIIVKFLMQHFALIANVSKRYNKRPIEVAAYNGHFAIVQLLLASGASIDDSLSCAAQTGHEDIVAFLFQYCERVGFSFCSYYALLEAAKYGHVGVCQLLLNARFSEFEYDMMKPIDLAAQYDHIDIVQLLLSHRAFLTGIGPSFERAIPGGNSKPRAIDFTITKGHIPITRLLFSHGYSLNKTFVLKNMIQNGRLLAVLAVLAMDNNLIDPTVISHLANSEKLEMVPFLLARRVSIDARDGEGNTLLHLACRYSSPETVVKNLIFRGAELNATNKEGKTPLHLATKFSLQEILIDSGADPHVVDRNGLTILHSTVTLELAQLLVQHNVLIDARTKMRVTPFIYACERGHKAIAEFLLQKNAYVNSKCKSMHETALHRVCRRKDVNCAELLLNWEAEVNITNLNGDTPLHLAVQADSVDIIKLLVEHGAHVNIMNKFGQTALDFAKTDEIAQLLEKGENRRCRH